MSSTDQNLYYIRGHESEKNAPDFGLNRIIKVKC
jgi:hypothetical protein